MDSSIYLAWKIQQFISMVQNLNRYFCSILYVNSCSSLLKFSQVHYYLAITLPSFFYRNDLCCIQPRRMCGWWFKDLPKLIWKNARITNYSFLHLCPSFFYFSFEVAYIIHNWSIDLFSDLSYSWFEPPWWSLRKGHSRSIHY